MSIASIRQMSQMPRRLLNGLTVLAFAGVFFSATPFPAGAEPLNLNRVDNAALLAIMQFNTQELLETVERQDRQKALVGRSVTSNECSVDIGNEEGSEDDDNAIFNNDGPIIVAAPVINIC